MMVQNYIFRFVFPLFVNAGSTQFLRREQFAAETADFRNAALHKNK